MRLTLKDRVIIIKTVLPVFDTRKGMELAISIEGKIRLEERESENVSAVPVGNGQFDVYFKTESAMTSEKDINFSDEELIYLKEKVDFIDRDGRFSVFTIPTYTKILDESLLNPSVEEHEVIQPTEEAYQELTVEPLSSGIIDETGKTVAKPLPKDVLEDVEEETYAH